MAKLTVEEKLANVFDDEYVEVRKISDGKITEFYSIKCKSIYAGEIYKLKTIGYYVFKIAAWDDKHVKVYVSKRRKD